MHAEKGHRLPLLEQNIKCGNSLIDDKKVAGNKAFKWEEEFEKIMKEGGFDVVIGNPPYGAKLTAKEKAFKKTRFKDDKTGNTASLFILKGLELVKEGGFLAYIVPKQLTYIASWESIREKLLEQNVVCIIDVSEAFEDVELEQVIFIIKKGKRTSEKLIVGFSNKSKFEQTYSNIKYLSKERFPLWINENNYSIFDKVLKDSLPLKDFAHVNWGGPVARYLTKNRSRDSIVCLRGREIKRYNMFPEHFIEKNDIVPSYIVKGEKLFVQRIVSRRGKKIVANYRDARLVATYCSQDYYADKTVTMIWDSRINLKYLLGVINSKLISWFAHRYLYNRSQLTMEFMYSYARNFPIRNSFTKNQESRVINLADKMLSLNKCLNKIGDKLTDERTRIENEIKKTDGQIDELVYKIYGITEAEKEIIKESSKTK